MTNAARTALVTGASRGLGLEVCRQLARRGDHVLLAARDLARAEALAAELAADGGHVTPYALDVTSDASVRALADRIAREGIALDVLVANAGVALDGFDADVARETLDVNTFGAARVIDALTPHLARGAAVVLVSSGMGELSCLGPALRRELSREDLTRAELDALLRGFVDAVARGDHTRQGWPSSAYRVSKAGMNALARILARELAARDVRVNAVCPGWVRTDMGGTHASRDVEEGARSIVWATTPGAHTGGFFRDGVAIPF